VSSASNTAIPPCTHERRPGTTVCLLCRQEARLAASDRRKKLFLRGTALAIVVAVIALGMSSAATFRSRSAAREQAAAAAPVAAKVASAAATTVDSIVPQGAQLPSTTAGATPKPSVAPAPSAAAAASDAILPPTIKAGDTPLGNGVVATRADSGVFVAFDTPELRTRTPEKFEAFLRATLGQIYGARMDSALAKVPAGRIVGQGDLLFELPTRGIQLAIQPGWHLEVFPEIRPGRDGPLVIRYRAFVAKD
jgi:hypothetical protein